jgi:hypothetical protein
MASTCVRAASAWNAAALGLDSRTRSAWSSWTRGVALAISPWSVWWTAAAISPWSAWRTASPCVRAALAAALGLDSRTCSAWSA